jgi:hypothetical protein
MPNGNATQSAALKEHNLDIDISAKTELIRSRTIARAA